MPKMTPEEHQDHSRKMTMLNLERRRNAWKNEECRKIYRVLVNAAGGASVVRPGMRGKAKEIAINCYLNESIPPIESFVGEVNTAKCSQFKAALKKVLEDETTIITGSMRNEGIDQILNQKREVNI